VGGLYRRRKDGSGDAQEIDPHCNYSPTVDGDYVYFCGGPGLNSLYRRPKDGSGGAQQLDYYCGGSPLVLGKYVYYLGTLGLNALYRRTIDGIGASQPLDPNGKYRPYLDGKYAYFCGGPARASLYRAPLPTLDPDKFREWMKDRWATIKDLPLWQVVLPSTHDSGCFDQDVLYPGAQAQDSNVGGQLRYGFRYFDLRFGKRAVLAWLVLMDLCPYMDR
jgi:hypothetical protein